MPRLRRRRQQLRIADAAVEPDPVDARLTAAGVAIAKMDPPQRRVRFRDELPGVAERLHLLTLAGLLPLAVDPDIESDGIVKGRGGAPFVRRYHQRQRGQCDPSPHPSISDTSGSGGQLPERGKCT